MEPDRSPSQSFGEVAELYDRTRPAYPAALVDDVVAGAARVLDVGCGTGIVARMFSARGCTVLGVEPDPRMAAVARSAGTEVESARFEEWDAGGRLFDAVVSGQAWHWIDPVAGAAKAASVLPPGGVLAVFWNHLRHRPAVRAVIDDVYGRLAPSLLANSLSLGTAGPQPDEDRRPIEADGSFSAVDVRTYDWARRYGRDEWLDELVTHSQHRMVSDELRQQLVGELRALLPQGFDVDYSTVLLRATRV